MERYIETKQQTYAQMLECLRRKEDVVHINLAAVNADGLRQEVLRRNALYKAAGHIVNKYTVATDMKDGYVSVVRL